MCVDSAGYLKLTPERFLVCVYVFLLVCFAMCVLFIIGFSPAFCVSFTADHTGLSISQTDGESKDTVEWIHLVFSNKLLM